MEQNTEARVLISLDTLLDTRIGTVSRISEELALKVLEANYHDRRSDFYPGVDKKVFDALYAKRDIETLKRSQLTNIVLLLKDMYASFVHTSMTTPYISRIKTAINVYPYILTDTLREGIRKAFIAWCGVFSDVEIVNISNEDLTPQYVKTHYDVLYMYRYDDWLESHTKDFEKTQIPQVDLYVPAISFTYDLTDALLTSLLKQSEGIHPLRQLQFGVAPFINLQPIDVSIFSVYAPGKIKAIQQIIKGDTKVAP